MQLPLFWSIVLVASAAWSFLVWPQFWRRVIKDPRARDEQGRPTRFYTVHAAIIAVSLVLALLVGIVGLLSLG